MTDIKTLAQGLDPNLDARDVDVLSKKTSNIYHSLAVIATRSRQLSNDLKNELHNKLEEFATVTDTIEEVHENKEQIEISKFYERLPHPTIIALDEFLNDQLVHRLLTDKKDDEDEGDV
jgi:DNA-directed RNA polymerase subunit K/omega